MGYYTNYRLSVTGDPNKVNAFRKAIKIKFGLKNKLFNDQERSDFEFLHNILENTYNGKFYDHERFFREVSAKNQDLTFIVDGEGEEPGDIWKKYFKNGKMFASQGRIVFDDYDENKLT